MQLDLHNKLSMLILTKVSTEHKNMCTSGLFASEYSSGTSLLSPFDMHLQGTHHSLSCSCTRPCIVYATKSVFAYGHDSVPLTGNRHTLQLESLHSRSRWLTVSVLQSIHSCDIRHATC